MTRRINLKESNQMNRVSRANALILKNNLSGKINNTKWKELFELLQSLKCKFRIKLLTDTEESIKNAWNNNFFELEQTDLLTDNHEDYGFIKFKEIERVDIIGANELETLLIEVKTISKSVYKNDNYVSIFGY